MSENQSEQLALLNTRIKILEAENALLSRQQEAHEDFIWAVLGMFSEKNMEVFTTWVSSVNQCIDKLPNGDRIRDALKKK